MKEGRKEGWKKTKEGRKEDTVGKIVCSAEAV